MTVTIIDRKTEEVKERRTFTTPHEALRFAYSWNLRKVKVKIED